MVFDENVYPHRSKKPTGGGSSMSSRRKQALIYASPKDVASKIAKIHGETPKPIRVKMVGSHAVETFVSRIEKARSRKFAIPLALD